MSRTAGPDDGGSHLIRQRSRSFPAELETLRAVRTLVRELCAAEGLSAEESDDLLVAVVEACTNVVRHSGAPEIHLRWRVGDGRVEVEVEDEGSFLHRAPDPERPGGFGIPLMQSLMDEVEIERGGDGRTGTRVVLVKRVAARPAAAAGRRSGPRARRLHPEQPELPRQRRSARRRPMAMLAVALASVVALGAIATAAIRNGHQAHPALTAGGGRSPNEAITKPSPAAHPKHDRPSSAPGSHPSLAPTPTHPSPRPSPAQSPAVTLPRIACPADPLQGLPVPSGFSVEKACTWVQGVVASAAGGATGAVRFTLRSTDGSDDNLPVVFLADQKLSTPRPDERIAVLGTLTKQIATGGVAMEPVWAVDYLDRGVVRKAKPVAPAPSTCVIGTTVCPSLPPSPVATPSLPVVP